MPCMLITGGAGFIGSHSATHFANTGRSVRVLDNLSRGALLGRPNRNVSQNWDRLATVARVERIRGDCTDPKTVQAAVEGVDVVIHAAGQTAVTGSMVDPASDFRINALGTLTVLEALRGQRGEKTFIYCSTNKVYGARVNDVPLDEGATRYCFPNAQRHGVGGDFAIAVAGRKP